MAEEAKKTEETPTLPKETPKKKEEEKPTPGQDVEGLLAELEKAGVSNVQELSGKLTASREAGNLANQLGTIRQENAELKAMMETVTQQSNLPLESVQEETDLNKMMEGSVEKVLDRREKRQREYNAKVQQAQNTMWAKIHGHAKYGVVKEIWEEKLKDPNFAMQIQQGMLNPLEEFHNTINEYWEGIAKRSVDTIKALQGKAPETKPPHVEGESAIPQIPVDATKQEARMKELKAKADTGVLSEEEELEAVALATQGLNWI